MAAKIFATVTDPLALGTGYEVFRVSTQVGGEWETIYDKDGKFLQSYSTDNLHTVRCEYYLESGATTPDRGSTTNGFVVDDTEISAQNRSHKTLSVTAHAHEDVALCDVVLR